MILKLLLLGAVVIAFFGVLFGWLWDEEMWGMIVGLVIIGISVGSYTEVIPGYEARIMLNPIFGTQRVLFQGLNFKMPWESVTRGVDLKTELKDVPEETWQSLDAKMDVKYVYTIKPRATEKDILLYGSFELDAIQMKGRSLISKLFSDYYRSKKSSDLKNKREVEEAVFGTGKDGLDLLHKFENEHGVEVTVNLEDSDVDEATQKVLDTAAKTEAMATAAQILIDKGWDTELAHKTVRQINMPNIVEYIINLDAKGLEQLQHFSVLGGLPGADKGGKK